MKFFELAKWEFRPLIYAMLITIGMSIVVTILETGDVIHFLLGAAFLYLIILAELYVNANHYHIKHRQGTSAMYEFEESRVTQFLHHLFLPSFLYIGIVAFTFFNNQPSDYLIVLVVTFIAFAILFENINSFYRHKLTLNKQTNYIYDFISIILVFLWTSVIINFVGRYDIQDEYLYIACPAILTPIFALNLLRHKFDWKSIILSIFMIAFISLVSIGLAIRTDVTTLFISFIAAFFYQSYNFAMSHYVDGKTDTYDLLDYLIVVILVFSLINLVS